MSGNDSKYPSELADRFQVRMPAGMRDRIKAAADANNRSMNAEILMRLEGSFRPIAGVKSLKTHHGVIQDPDHTDIVKNALELAMQLLIDKKLVSVPEIDVEVNTSTQEDEAPEITATKSLR